MLRIILENGDESEWRIGYPSPLPWLNIQSVVKVQIDDDELNYIDINFDSIPIHRTKKVQCWFGDMAKFIVASLGE